MQFNHFEIARCGEWAGADCAPIGWTGDKGRNPPDSVFWTLYGRDGDGMAHAIADTQSRAVALLKLDAIAPGATVDVLDAMTPGFRVTWETFTAESVEIGDAESRGFVRYDGGLEELDPTRLDPTGDIYEMTFRDAIAALSRASGDVVSVEANDSDSARARWVTAHFRTYGRGDQISESRAIHFPETLTPASRARLVKLLTN